MKFRIRRLSDVYVKPCEKAFEENKEWFIKIRTISELFTLIPNEDFIIKRNYFDNNCKIVRKPIIIIYDDWYE